MICNVLCPETLAPRLIAGRSYNAPRISLHAFFLYGAASWAAFSLAYLAHARATRDLTICLSWYGAFALLTIVYFFAT
jgi:hypothetical protein